MDILRKHIEPTEEYAAHIMPFDDQNLPIIAVVRDPVTWWGSWITWGRFHKTKDPYYNGLLHENDMREADNIVEAYRMNMPKLARESSTQCVADMARKKQGPLTHRIGELLKHDVQFVRFDDLRQGWCDALDNFGLLTKALKNDLLTTPAYNETARRAEITVDISDMEHCHGVI